MALDFLGPIISTSSLDRWKSLLVDGFGLEQVSDQLLYSGDVAALWGVQADSARTAWFATPGTPYGIRLVQLAPASPVVIRNPSSGYDCNALKVIDFYAPDFAAAQKQLDAAGFQLKEDIAQYDLDVGQITEGHLWGPDNVVCALISGPPAFFSEFVTVSNATFSEVLSVSAPVDGPAAVVAFYEHLGLSEVYRYEVTDHSFQKLVGAAKPLHIRAINMGVVKEKPYFGVIHYGLPADQYVSLADRAVFPNRGLVAATVSVDNLAAVVEKLASSTAELLCPPSQQFLEPHGPVNTMLVRAPHGVLHQLIEIDAAA